MAPPLLDVDHTVFHSPPMPDTAVAGGPRRGGGLKKEREIPLHFSQLLGQMAGVVDPHLCI